MTQERSKKMIAAIPQQAVRLDKMRYIVSSKMAGNQVISSLGGGDDLVVHVYHYCIPAFLVKRYPVIIGIYIVDIGIKAKLFALQLSCSCVGIA
jgi:hypothetical protein